MSGAFHVRLWPADTSWLSWCRGGFAGKRCELNNTIIVIKTAPIMKYFLIKTGGIAYLLKAEGTSNMLVAALENLYAMTSDKDNRLRLPLLETQRGDSLDNTEHNQYYVE